MNLSFQAIVVLAMLVQKALIEQKDITDLLAKMEFFLNNEGQLQVFNPEDFKLDLSLVMPQEEGQGSLFDVESV